MSAHTPEPWDLKDFTTLRGGYISIHYHGLRIGDVFPFAKTTSGVFDQHMANARLIAAAPTMYDALHLAERALADLGACADEHCTEPNCLHALVAVRAAIARAEGRTESSDDNTDRAADREAATDRQRRIDEVEAERNRR